MGVRDSADWLPEYNLSQLECIKASRTMAEFCVLAANDPEVSQERTVEILGSFACVCALSVQGKHLSSAMRVDLEDAGLGNETAVAWADSLSDDSIKSWAASGAFIRRNRPTFGLYKKAGATQVDPSILVKKINKLVRR